MFLHALSYMFGALLILLVLLDVFLTVLYARVGAGVISHQLACGMWWTFRTLSKPFARYSDQILSFCGPAILVALVGTWLFGLIIGGALIVHPQLGTGIQATSGDTPKDFVTAMYIVGDALSTVGTSDMAPKTSSMRLLFTFLSLTGIATLTLTLTYFLEIYNALQARNTYAVKLHHATSDTADAAELIAGLGARGHFSVGYAHLSEMAAETIQLYEAHHFYAVLLYFRFREPHYALSRAALVTLDTVTLIKSALNDDEDGWVKESAAVAQIWRSTTKVLAELASVFLPGGLPEHIEPNAEELERWRHRYRVALVRLRQAGIQTIADEQQGEETYIALRARWNRYLVAFANHMLYPMEQIDPVGADPASATDRPDFSRRLRAAG